MGKYLNKDLNGKVLGPIKTNKLYNSGAKQIIEPETYDQYEGKAIICVVDNGFFEAAAYAFSQNELEAFKNPSDNRNKVWMIADKELVESLVD